MILRNGKLSFEMLSGGSYEQEVAGRVTVDLDTELVTFTQPRDREATQEELQDAAEACHIFGMDDEVARRVMGVVRDAAHKHAEDTNRLSIKVEPKEE